MNEMKTWRKLVQNKWNEKLCWIEMEKKYFNSIQNLNAFSSGRFAAFIAVTVSSRFRVKSSIVVASIFKDVT